MFCSVKKRCIFTSQTTTMKKATITPEKLNTLLATKQAKAWGFKSVSDATKNGYNTLRTSADLSEIKDILKISQQEAYDIARGWASNGLVVYTSCANLNCIYFRK